MQKSAVNPAVANPAESLHPSICALSVDVVIARLPRDAGLVDDMRTTPGARIDVPSACIQNVAIRTEFSPVLKE
jgi:hypothetical protein